MIQVQRELCRFGMEFEDALGLTEMAVFVGELFTLSGIQFLN